MALTDDEETNYLVDQFQTQLDVFVKSKRDKDYKDALRKGVVEYFIPIIRNFKFGVINIAGRGKTGKTTLAHKLAFLLTEQSKYQVKVTFDFINGMYDLSPNKILIVESGNIDLELKDNADTYGIEQYYNACNRKESIAIIVSSRRIEESYVNVSLETIGLTTSGGAIVVRAMWYMNGLPIGYVDFTEISEEHIEFQEDLLQKTDKARLEFNKTELERVIENIPQSTKRLLKTVFPPMHVLESKPVKDKDDNAIEPLKVLLLGDVNSGKTTMAKILHAQADSKYPTYARKHANDLGILYKDGWSKDKKYFCQMLLVEDATYNLDTSPIVADMHIRFRHLMNEAGGGTEEDRTKGRQTGLASVIVALHRLTGDACPIRFRNSFDWQFLLELPTLKWDRDYIRGMLGSDLSYDFLVWLNAQRIQAKASGDVAYFNELMGMGVAIGKDNEAVPFQLHSSQYATKPFIKIKGTSKWSENWRQVARKIRDEIIRNQWNPTNPIIESLINELETEWYGYIRLASEGRINYRTVVKNDIKAYFDKIKSEESDSKYYTTTAVSRSDTKTRNEANKGSWKYRKIAVTGNTIIYDKLVDLLDSKLSDNPFYIAYKLWIEGEPQTSPAIKLVFKKAGFNKAPDQSRISREFKNISTEFGYALEEVLLHLLGNQLWIHEGGNDSAPDLYSDSTLQTISVKYRRNPKFAPTNAGHKNGRKTIISEGEAKKFEEGHQLWVLLYEVQNKEFKLWSVNYDAGALENVGIPFWWRTLTEET